MKHLVIDVKEKGKPVIRYPLEAILPPVGFKPKVAAICALVNRRIAYENGKIMDQLLTEQTINQEV